MLAEHTKEQYDVLGKESKPRLIEVKVDTRSIMITKKTRQLAMIDQISMLSQQ